jgi:hypothetical protein
MRHDWRALPEIIAAPITLLFVKKMANFRAGRRTAPFFPHHLNWYIF